MVRASTIGAVDFTKFDPKDKWCWDRLRLVLRELHRQDEKQLGEIQHRHWAMMTTVYGLDNEHWENARDNSNKYLLDLVGFYFPWMKDSIKAAGDVRDSALQEYRDTWGYPGDPQYEQMLKDQAEAWRKIKAGWGKKGQLQEGAA